MSVQLSYSYITPQGIAGSLEDIAPYAIDSRLNAEPDEDTMLFGMGAVCGPNPGVDVLVPTATSTPDLFEGLVLTGFTNQMDMMGQIKINPLKTVGVLRYGHAWARVAEGVEPTYGDPLYLINTGDEAGLFTNIATDAIAVNGRFRGPLGSSSVAPVEIYNQKP